MSRQLQLCFLEQLEGYIFGKEGAVILQSKTLLGETLTCPEYKNDQNYFISLITGFSQAWVENPSSWATVWCFPFLLFMQQREPHIGLCYQVRSQQA